MAVISYKYMTVRGTKTYNVSLLDQDTMYATGNAGSTNEGTIADGFNYNMGTAALFLASGGVILRNVKGSDSFGNSYGYKNEDEAGTGNAGYYINSQKVCSWIEGLGGNVIVHLLHNSNTASNLYDVVVITNGNAQFINGNCINGSALSFEEPQTGWGRMIKGNWSEDGKLVLTNNNSSGGSLLYTLWSYGTNYTAPASVTIGGAHEVGDNPYSYGGYSESGGGDGNKQNFGDTSDFVNPDALPDESEIGAVSCGLLTIFSPTQAELRNLAALLWSHDFFTFIEKQVTGIDELFVSLGIVPFRVETTGQVDITWLNYFDLVPSPAVVPTEVLLTKAASQWQEFNMGNVSLTGNDDRMYASDSVLDYSPYSRLGIYLPFIGYQELDIDECREKSINLKYRVDILSGACVALISINGRTLYQFSGNCMTQIPLTTADYSSAISTAVNVGLAAASAGTTAAIASAGDALTASRLESEKIDKATGEYQNALHAAQVSNAENSLAGATANGFMGMKPNFKKTGAISGSTGLMSVKQPYLCLTTPRQSMPEGYEKVCGFPCNMGGKLSNFTGYTVVEDIRLNGLVATSPEVEEIYQLLKSGVII